MRLILGALLVGSVIALTACGDILEDVSGLKDEDIPKRWEAKLTFHNNSDSVICYSKSLDEATSPDRRCSELEPRTKTVWRLDCAYGDAAGFWPLTVVLSERLDARKLYDRTETCAFWENAKAEFWIDEHEGELQVQDNLPDATPTP